METTAVNGNSDCVNLNIDCDATPPYSDGGFETEIGVGREPNPYPTYAFPPAVRDLILNYTKATNFSVPLTATALLTVASAAIGNTTRVQGQLDGTPTILYTLLIASSGGGKSPVMNFAKHPLTLRNKSSFESWKSSKNSWDSVAKDADKGDEPVWSGQTIVKDATPEALYKAFSNNPRGFLYYKDEGLGFYKDIGRYNKNGFAQELLSLYDGEGQVINRVGRPAMLVSNPHMSILMGTQTNKIPEIATYITSDDGAVFRYTFAYDDTLRKDKTDILLEERLRDEWTRCVNKILSLELTPEEPRIIKLSGEAVSLLASYEEELWKAKQLAHEQADWFTVSALSKQGGKVIRYACVLEALAFGCECSRFNEITGQAMSGAIALGRYHYNVLTETFRPPSEGNTEVVAERLKGAHATVFNALPNEFTTSSLIEMCIDCELYERANAPASVKQWLKRGKSQGLWESVKHGSYRKLGGATK